MFFFSRRRILNERYTIQPEPATYCAPSQWFFYCPACPVERNGFSPSPSVLLGTFSTTSSQDWWLPDYKTSSSIPFPAFQGRASMRHAPKNGCWNFDGRVVNPISLHISDDMRLGGAVFHYSLHCNLKFRTLGCFSVWPTVYGEAHDQYLTGPAWFRSMSFMGQISAYCFFE